MMVSISALTAAAVMLGLGKLKPLTLWRAICLTGLTILPAPLASGQTAKYSPEDEISFRVNIPPSTASSEDGPIYLQLQAPAEMEWVGLGQGSSMSGANMFVVYASSPSNITISPRLGTGHSMPKHNPDTEVTLLEGSGIEDGVMTANFRCDNCLSWDGGSMDPTDSASSWIWAGTRGEPLDSDSTSEPISHHDTKGAFSFDLTEATGGSSANPFANISGDDEQQSNSGSQSAGSGLSPVDKMRTAHGILMSFVFVIFFPSFALSLHLFPGSKTVSRIHAPLQVTALALGIAGLGVGVAMAREIEAATGYHPIIGYVVMGYFIAFQPALGLFHHLHFRKTGEKSLLGYAHRWFGRLFLALGIINGGWGFQYAGIGTKGVPTGGIIAYGVISGVMGVAYIAVIIFDALKKSKKAKESEQPTDNFSNLESAEAKTNGSSTT